MFHQLAEGDLDMFLLKVEVFEMHIFSIFLSKRKNFEC